MSKTHAPAAAERLAQAETILRDLEGQLGPLALEASEGDTAAGKKLAALETQIAAARREVDKLERAHRHAVQVDRESAVADIETMRDGQVTAFSAAMQIRLQEMDSVMGAVKTLMAAYGRYSEATLKAAISAPAGTVVPQMSCGPNGCYGSAYGPCGQLILAELWRTAPMREDQMGRFVLPFADKSPLVTTADRREFAPAIDAFKAATTAIIDDVADQVQKLNAAGRASLEPKKEAA